MVFHVDTWKGYSVHGLTFSLDACGSCDLRKNYLPPVPLPPGLRHADEFFALDSNQLDAALSLIQAQNETISNLCAEIRSFSCQGSALQLGGDPSPNVDIPGPPELLKNELHIQKRFYELLRPHVVDLLTSVGEHITERVTSAKSELASICSHQISELLRTYDTMIQRQLRELNLQNAEGAQDIDTNGNSDQSVDIALGDYVHRVGNGVRHVDEENRMVPSSAGFRGSLSEIVEPGVIDVASESNLNAECSKNAAVQFQSSKTEPVASISCNEELEPSIGDTVCVRGLLTACYYNDKFAMCLVMDSDTNRYMIRAPAGDAAIKIKRCNIQFPARRSECCAELTYSGCLPCGNGIHTCAPDNCAASNGDLSSLQITRYIAMLM